MREAVSSVSVIFYSPDIHIRISGKCAVAVYCHICAFVVETIVVSGKGFVICRRIDHNLIPVCRQGSLFSAVGNGVLQCLHRAVHAFQHCCRFQRTVFSDDRHIIRTVKLPRLICLICRVASVQREVNLCPGRGCSQCNCCSGRHLSRLRSRLGRRYRAFGGAAGFFLIKSKL